MGIRLLMMAICALALGCGDDSGSDTGGVGSDGAGDGDGDVTGDGDGDASGDGDATPVGDGDASGDGDGDATASAFKHIAGGSFAPLAAYDASTASGVALIAVGQDDTEVSVQTSGLDADTAYPAHVHALPCALSGGGHYKLDAAETEALEDNEIWLTLTTDGDGGGVREVSVDHVARAEAQALVIHDDDGMRLACIDLL